MKVLVAYYSETGNTKKLAQAIHDGIAEVEKKITPIQELKDAKGYDLVFCGFPVKAHSVPDNVVAFIEKLPEGQNVAFFATHGSLRGGQMAITAFYHALSLTAKDKVLGTFGCRGKVKPGIIQALMEKSEHRAWAIEAQSAEGHPDGADFEDAREWAQAMINKTRSL